MVGRDLERVQSFWLKLRIMMNMEKDPAVAGSAGDRPGTRAPICPCTDRDTYKILNFSPGFLNR